MRERLSRHQNSSPSSLITSFNSLEKGVKLIAHGASMIEVELGKLREANATLSKRKQRKRKIIKGATSQLVADGLQMSVRLQAQNVIAENSGSGDMRIRQPRRCGRCCEPGHRVETCKLPFPATPINIDPILLSKN
jgi:hypothetical protein